MSDDRVLMITINNDGSADFYHRPDLTRDELIEVLATAVRVVVEMTEFQRTWQESIDEHHRN